MRRKSSQDSAERGLTHCTQHAWNEKYHRQQAAIKAFICLQMGKDLIEITCWVEAMIKMCIPQARQKKSSTVNWNIIGWQDKRSFRVSESPERAQGWEEADGSEEGLYAAAPQNHRRRGTCSRFSPPACSLSLSAVADITSLSPCGCHIERSHFICQLDRNVGGFFCQYILVMRAVWGSIAKLQPSVSQA